MEIALLLLALSALIADDAAQPPAPQEPRSHLVHSGLAWHLVAAECKPGDQVLLEKGFHISGRVEDLHGTRERPIVIRGADASMPSAIACEETGIELIRCSWVRIENLYFINATDAAIVIDGSPAPQIDAMPAQTNGGRDGPAAAGDAAHAPRVETEPMDVSIAVSACRVSTSREMPGMDAIRIRNARNVGIAQCVFENWSESAVSIDGGVAVVIARCAFTPGGDWTHRFGVRIGGGSRLVALHQNTLERGITTGVQVGACASSTDGGTVPSAAREVQIARSLMLEVDCPLEVGPGSDARMSECTIVDPIVMYRLDGRCGAPRLALASNLLQWTAGRLRVVVETHGSIASEMVTLDRNLWWSDELPIGFEATGRPFGVEVTPQVIDVDPKLSEKSFAPTAPKAMEFGWMASMTQNATAQNPAADRNATPAPPPNAPTPPAAPPAEE